MTATPLAAARRWVPAVVLAAAVLAGCGTTSGTSSPVDLPLTWIVASSAGDVATVPMGSTASTADTFWEVFLRAPGATRWALATPPGIATNGGVVATERGRDLYVGVLASARLRFSVVEMTSDGGRTWATGVLPGTLTHAPDALAAGPHALLALLGARGTEVVESSGDLSGWRTLATLRVLQVAAGRSSATRCTLSGVSAVGWSGSVPLVAGRCADGRGIVFALRPPGIGSFGVGTVVRLAGDPLQAALVVRGPHQARPGSTWLRAVQGAASIPLGPAGDVVATGTDLVVLATAAGCVAYARVGGQATPTRTVRAALPTRACAAAASGGGFVALGATGSRLDAYVGRMGRDGSVRWALVEQLAVPIQVGSSR